MVEQDPRFIKRLVNPGMGFGTFNTARRTLRGYEAMNMIRKGQILAVEKGDILGQAEYARENFWSCCITRSEERKNFCFQAVLATQPVKPHWGLGKKTTLLVVSGFVPPACEDGRIAD